MALLVDEITADYVTSVITDDVSVPGLLEILEAKGGELGKRVGSMEELEGSSRQEGDLLFILEKCPMSSAIDEIKKRNGGELPNHFDRVVEAFKKKYPGRGAILHPLCIIHQVVRTTFGMEQGLYFEEVACRSADSGEIAFAKDGLVMSELSEEEARRLVEGSACLYYVG